MHKIAEAGTHLPTPDGWNAELSGYCHAEQMADCSTMRNFAVRLISAVLLASGRIKTKRVVIKRFFVGPCHVRFNFGIVC